MCVCVCMCDRNTVESVMWLFSHGFVGLCEASIKRSPSVDFLLNVLPNEQKGGEASFKNPRCFCAGFLLGECACVSFASHRVDLTKCS